MKFMGTRATAKSTDVTLALLVCCEHGLHMPYCCTLFLVMIHSVVGKFVGGQRHVTSVCVRLVEKKMLHHIHDSNSSTLSAFPDASPQLLNLHYRHTQFERSV